MGKVVSWTFAPFWYCYPLPTLATYWKVQLHSNKLSISNYHDHVDLVPDGQAKYTKQKCKDGPKGACFELVNAAGQPEVFSIWH